MTLNSFKISVLHVLRHYLLQLSFSDYTDVERAKVQYEMLRMIFGLSEFKIKPRKI